MTDDGFESRRKASVIVSTERSGWPSKQWWSVLLPVEVQRHRRYEIEPDRPTATCHVQQGPEQAALCGLRWQGLVESPAKPAWWDLHPQRRRDECSSEVELSETPREAFLFSSETPSTDA